MQAAAFGEHLLEIVADELRSFYELRDKLVSGKQ